MAQSKSKLGLLTGKHIAVDKANTQVIVAVSVAVASIVFALFASLSLFEKIKYQNKVISARNKASAQLTKNVESTQTLVNSYVVFDSSTGSVIGTSDKNSKIVLDALPSKYDFPALATSLESIVRGAGLAVSSIAGHDEEATAVQSSVEPTIVAIPFDVAATGNYESVQRFIKDLERSIRPMKIKTVQISGAQNSLTVLVSAETYYMPARELGVVEKLVPVSGSAKQETTTKTTGATE